MNKRNQLFILSSLFILALAFGISAALAKPNAVSAVAASPLHPTFALLDASEKNVLESGAPLSTMKTCGQCHDTEFIQKHAFHSDLGLADYKAGKNIDSSNGIFGKWDPLTYRYLSQSDDERIDLSTAEWLKLYGDRVIGGGPATTARDGKNLTSLAPSTKNPESSILNRNGKVELWDWKISGTMEMNCFVCHLKKPNNQARVSFIKGGWFGDANTATLLGLGITDYDGQTGTWLWNSEAFDEGGKLKPELLNIQDPTNTNCAACHGEVHPETEEPLTISACDLNEPQTATTGQVVASQKISQSGVNLSDKENLNRSWDIHAERQLQCTDCHYALNNPAHASEAQGANPAHLVYDPRTLEIGEYLQRPDHNIARGQSSQFNVSPELKGTMRRCDSCHDANIGHADWLPYIDTHMNAVACESCHIPQMYAPAIQSYDWTVISTDGNAMQSCRGVDGDPNDISSLVTGYEPILLNRTNIDGNRLLAPYNLITSFYWVYDDSNGNKRPVRLVDLEATYLNNGKYAADIVTAFDTNADGKLGKDELRIDSSAKEEIVKAKLAALGLKSPHIEGTVQPYSINHSVTQGKYALNDCTVCHTKESRIDQPIKLADYDPNNILPAFVTDTNVNGTGEIVKGNDGALYYQPKPASDKLYVFGSSNVKWIDWFGALLFVGVLLGVSGHGTIRYFASLRQPKGHAKTERIYMYQAYERFWHWLQTVVIVILLFTGLIIHRPDLFGAFSFRGVVVVHNVLAAILAINAFLSLFYHLTTGHIRQFIPRPYGFFDDAIEQALYYIKGIFKGEVHPFAKTPGEKMNPLQQATYFAILNVLLPLQGLTGILMWGVQRWPQVANWFGGLPFLAPLHTLTAWIFAAFIVGHVYLTTTGATPLEAIRGMVTGFEEVEVHALRAPRQKKVKSKK